MGTKQLIILFLTYFLVTGCTREADISSGEKTEEKVRVSLSIHLDNNNTTRSSWNYDRYFPEITPEEKEVTDITVIVFRDNVFELYKHFGSNEFEIDQNDHSISLKEVNGEDVLELEPGPHYFYTILNIPDDSRITLNELLNGQEGRLSRSEFERIILNKSLKELTGNSNKFVMTNSNSPKLRGIYSQDQIENNSELDNNVQITVGRAVGKISFAYVANELETGELHGGLSDISYCILNNPAKMYLMPVIENNILLTPHYENYPTESGYFTPSAKGILNDEDWLPATTSKRVEDNQALAYGYCIENNNKSPLRSSSAMVLIKAKFTPAVWLNDDGTVGDKSSDGTFWRIGCYNINGVLYAYEQGYYNNEPSAEVMKQYKNTATSIYTTEKYEQGLTYYGFWPKQGDQYMVKRNNYYKIAITHIHGAGVPEPGDVIDPDVDPEDPATYGRLAVYAVTWIEDNVEVILGENPDEGETIDTNPKVTDWVDNKKETELESGSSW